MQVQWRRVDIKTVHCCHLTPSASRSIIAGLYIAVKSCASVWYCSSEGYSLVECMAAAQHLWHQSNICGTKLIFPKSKQAAQGCYKQRTLSSPPPAAAAVMHISVMHNVHISDNPAEAALLPSKRRRHQSFQEAGARKVKCLAG